jgi:hypothetical protein
MMKCNLFLTTVQEFTFQERTRKMPVPEKIDLL